MENRFYLYDDTQDIEEDSLQLEFECFENDMHTILRDHSLVAEGYEQCWDGKYSGGKVITSWRGLTNLFQDHNRVWIEDAELYLEAIHHDGINHIKMRLLSKRGEDYFNNHASDYEYNRKEVVEKLVKPPYSKKLTKDILEMLGV